MVMAHRIVAVRVEPIAVDLGLWCNRCMLSSARRVWVVMSLGQRMHLQERLWCRECHSGAFVVNDRT